MLWVLLVAAVFVSAEEEPKGAWLLASKAPQSQYGVEGLDYVVEYGLYNVGDRPATKITLDDRNSYPSQYFEILRGVLQVSVERLNPGENFTHAVILRPLHSGLFNYTAAQLTYRPDENSQDLRVGLTTAPGEGYVYRQKEYERRFSSKSSYFFTFFLLMAPFTLGSAFLYTQSIKKYANYNKQQTSEPEKKKSH